MSAAAAPYQTGDKVLAYHGPRLYPAKIIEVDTEGTDPRFFIHYEGWKHFRQQRPAAERAFAAAPGDFAARVRWLEPGAPVTLAV